MSNRALKEIGEAPAPNASEEEKSLYLDLLAKVITNTLLNAEPDIAHENEFQFVDQFIRHYIQGPALSTLPLARFQNLRASMDDVIRNNVPGDFIETGVWRGGATIFMRAFLKLHGITDRYVWVADSFEGLPEPDAEQFPLEAKTHHGPVMSKVYNRFAAGLEDVKNNFRAFDLLDEQVVFLQGWFKDTLSTAPIDALAVMRLDGDYYESTMDGLVNLYDRLSPGGYAIIDDYGEDSWTYCRKAVDDFRRERGIQEPLIGVDAKCYYWRKNA
jgi:hypothetical protein